MCYSIVRQTVQTEYGAGKSKPVYIFTACRIDGVHFEAAGLNDIEAVERVSGAEQMVATVKWSDRIAAKSLRFDLGQADFAKSAS